MPTDCWLSTLSWVHFGGPKGIYLRSLVAVSSTKDFEIEFHYNTDEIPTHERMLGRRCSTTLKPDKPMQFAIDGPGGEVIETIEVDILRRTGFNLHSIDS